MMSLAEGSIAGLIPCSYQFPPDVHYTTCVLNMKNLQCGKISKTITFLLLKWLEGTEDYVTANVCIFLKNALQCEEFDSRQAHCWTRYFLKKKDACFI